MHAFSLSPLSLLSNKIKVNKYFYISTFIRVSGVPS